MNKIKKNNSGIDNALRFIKWIIFILLLILVVSMSWYTIPAGHRGVVLTFGKPAEKATGEGFHLKIPFVQSIIKMDIRTQKYEAELTAASRDLQDVKTKIAINYRISPERTIEIYRQIGINYAEIIIYPLEQEVNKATTAQFTAVDLINKRDEVREKMRNTLKERLTERGIFVEEISIINFEFSESFSNAIEAKVTAEQNALAAKNKLEQIRYEADQRVTQAKGEADAIAIQAQAINAQGGKDYVALQAISKWDGKLPQYMMGETVPFINIGKT